jgi:hypothetical protein
VRLKRDIALGSFDSSIFASLPVYKLGYSLQTESESLDLGLALPVAELTAIALSPSTRRLEQVAFDARCKVRVLHLLFMTVDLEGFVPWPALHELRSNNRTLRHFR